MLPLTLPNLFSRLDKYLMLPNGSIKSLSRREKRFGSVSGSIRNYAYTVSSAES